MSARLAGLTSFELMGQAFMKSAMEIAHLNAPFGESYSVYVPIETLGESDEGDRRALEQSLERMLRDY
ncbi:hypothetical protein [Paraburkholderia panacisoli]|jgi:hypothetical protein|uniref:hypothetical protein n=1 Tax=Paraburkholderia panacisoli TaxID=2603818 RepID=UPI00165FE248|nr:hypothetical protein [Paraburkholderia panacisoli]